MTLDSLVNELPKSYTPQDIALVRRAFELAAAAHEGQLRKSGEAYIEHPLEVARILANLRLDSRTIAAALLHDVVEDTPTNVPDLVAEFGAEVASLVDGVTKLIGIAEMANLPPDSRDPKVESLRKMLLAMVGDVRVVLIKLADRLHNMRTLDSMLPEKQRRISRETLDIYAPLANALGIYQIKWELEDLAFSYLEPETYTKIGRELSLNNDVREAYVKNVTQTLQAALAEHGIHEASVKSRSKHIYSIYRKMRKKGLNTSDEIYDQLGIRILVPDVADCYAALGVVHTLWRPIKGEFDDYIANPKENQYRSLHTAVYGPEGKNLEVQIRTPEMDRIADTGIAAHWRYKSQDRHDEAFERKIQWLRSIIEWASQDNSQPDDFLATVKEDLFKDRVYVFTPKGEPIDLPVGATPIDFAYQIHTEVGHRCRGAKVNGKQVGLDYQLKTGEQVEITTAKRGGGPSRDWLNPNLGYIKTARAKNKMRQWFRQQDRELNITAGREMLQNELNRLGVEMTHQEVATLFGRAEVDDFLEDLGCGETHDRRCRQEGAGAQQGRGAAQGDLGGAQTARVSRKCRRSRSMASRCRASATCFPTWPAAAMRCRRMKSWASSRAAAGSRSTGGIAPTSPASTRIGSSWSPGASDRSAPPGPRSASRPMIAPACSTRSRRSSKKKASTCWMPRR